MLVRVNSSAPGICSLMFGVYVYMLALSLARTIKRTTMLPAATHFMADNFMLDNSHA
jgi:hypothetical protein